MACALEPGEKLRIIKLLAYSWSSLRLETAVRDQVASALSGARFSGWDGLVEAQKQYLDEFWECADVEVEGNAEMQQAVRFGLFHVLQAGARAERRAIPSKGLTGPGYSGHTFWDSEMFVLPLLTYTVPKAAADALRWRHSTLDLARARASELGLAGAAFPWRTIRGHECSSYWPAGTAAFHINCDIASAVERYVRRHRRRRRSSARSGWSCSSRPPGCACRSGTTTGRRLAPRRCHRAGRVQRDRRRQRLHEPDGGQQPGRRGRRGRGATRTSA